MKNCPEFNIVKRKQTCKYLSYFSGILYNSTVPFNGFSIFTKLCHKFHFPTLFTNLLTYGTYVMHVVSCVDKQNVARRRQGFN